MSQHLYRHRDRIVWLDGWMVLLECLVVVRGWMVEWFCKSAWLDCLVGWVDGFVRVPGCIVWLDGWMVL